MTDYGMEIKQIRVMFWASFSNGTAGFSKRTLTRTHQNDIADKFFTWMNELTANMSDEFAITNCGVIK